MNKATISFGLAVFIVLLCFQCISQAQKNHSTGRVSSLGNSATTKPNKTPVNKKIVGFENESHEVIIHTYVYDILKKCNNNREKATNLIRKHMIIEVNIIRKKYHLHELKENEDLCILAQRHSEYMQKENFYSHTTKDGKGLGKRAYDIGLKRKCMMENIDKGSITIDQLINDVWMGEEAHRGNILQKDIDRIGAGCVFGEKFDDTSSIYRTIDGAKFRD